MCDVLKLPTAGDLAAKKRRLGGLSGPDQKELNRAIVAEVPAFRQEDEDQRAEDAEIAEILAATRESGC